MSFHETMVHANLRCLRRAVVDSKAQLSAERKLATVRRLCGKFVNMRHPSFLRNADGSRVEDQSLWGGIVSEHFMKKFHCSDAVCPDAIRELWRLRVNGALRRGHSPGQLRYAEFCEAFELIKVNVATSRDNIPGSVLRLLPVKVRRRLYCAVVERLAGREDEHVKDWAGYDVCLVPEKGDISFLGRWRPISLVPSLFKLLEVCLWKVLDKELRPLRCQMFGFRAGRQCLDIV